MAASAPLLAVTDEAGNSTYSVPQDAIDLLHKIEGPIAVIAVAGVYRTGKSFLLNCLAQNRGNSQQLFEVGPTIRACTSGLWVAPTAFSVPQEDGPALTVLFVDSEGLGAVRAGQQHDLQIFSLSMLLSSLFMFNSIGAIDEQSIAQLSFVSQLAEHIQQKAGAVLDPQNDSNGDNSFPDFIWVLRDFTLVNQDTDGIPITADQYLRNALDDEPGISDEVEEKNYTRMLIRTFFNRRRCKQLIRPADEEKDLSNLKTPDSPGIRKQFLKEIDELRDMAFKMVKPKTICGKPLTGPMMATLLQAYVTSINCGEVMVISDAWDAVIKMQSGRAFEKACATFDNFMEVTATAFPMAQPDLNDAYEKAKGAAVDALKADMLEPDLVELDRIRDILDQKYQQFQDRNRAATKSSTNARLTQLWESASKKAGDDWNKLIRQWNNTRDDFKRQSQSSSAVDVEEILNDFFVTSVFSKLQIVFNKHAEGAKATAIERQAQDSAALKKMSEDHAETLKKFKSASEKAASREEKSLSQIRSLKDDNQKLKVQQIETTSEVEKRNIQLKELQMIREQLDATDQRNENLMAEAHDLQLQVEQLESDKLNLEGQLELMNVQLENRDGLEKERRRQQDVTATDNLDFIQKKDDLIEQLQDDLQKETAENQRLSADNEMLRKQGASPSPTGELQMTIQQKTKYIKTLEEARNELQNDNENLKAQVRSAAKPRRRSGWCGSKR